MSSADQFSLEGKTAFVTGASYGLGVGFARALAEAGANVLAARSVDKLTEVATQLDGLGVKTLVQHCDVTDPATVKAAVAAAWEMFGRVDVLVNNAGVVAEVGMMPERIPDEVFAQTMNTNVNGVFTVLSGGGQPPARRRQGRLDHQHRLRRRSQCATALPVGLSSEQGRRDQPHA